MNLISHNEYYMVKIEYGDIMKEYVTAKDTKSTDYEVWNIYTKKAVTNPGVRKIAAEEQRGFCQT